MKLLTTTFFTLLLMGFTGSSYGQFGLFGPSDYDECIIEGMQGVQSNRAASAITRSCRQKFPRPANGPLTAAELGKLSLTELNWPAPFAGSSYALLSFNLHNSNNFAVSSIVVNIVTYRKEGSENIKTGERAYTFDSPSAQRCASSFALEDFSAAVEKWNSENDSWGYRLVSGQKC